MQLLIPPWELRLLLELQAASTHQVARRRNTSQPTIWRAYRSIVRRILEAKPYVRIELLARRPKRTAFTDADDAMQSELLDNGIEWESLTNQRPARIRRGKRAAYERAAYA